MSSRDKDVYSRTDPCDRTGGLEHPVSGRRTDRGHIPVEHHEGEPPIAFERILARERFDGVALLRLNPVVSRDHGVVFVALP